MDNCLFCKIVKGEIPSFKIYEDAYTYAFLDISNDGAGHTLVVPKHHAKSIADVSQEDLAHVMNTVQKVSNHLIENCGFDGVNVFNNCNESEGQVIMHLHFHILPRKDGDVIEKWHIDGKHGKTLEEVYELVKMQ